MNNEELEQKVERLVRYVNRIQSRLDGLDRRLEALEGGGKDAAPHESDPWVRAEKAEAERDRLKAEVHRLQALIDAVPSRESFAFHPRQPWLEALQRDQAERRAKREPMSEFMGWLDSAAPLPGQAQREAEERAIWGEEPPCGPRESKP